MRMLSKKPDDRWLSMEEATIALGARPLPRDDPTRSQLMTLARTSVNHRIISQVQTPRSPIPLTRRRGHAELAGPTPVARRNPLLLGGAGLALLAAGYLIARLAAPDTRTSVVSESVPAVDSAAPLSTGPVSASPGPPPPTPAPEPGAPAPARDRTSGSPAPTSNTPPRQASAATVAGIAPQRSAGTEAPPVLEPERSPVVDTAGQRAAPRPDLVPTQRSDSSTSAAVTTTPPPVLSRPTADPPAASVSPPVSAVSAESEVRGVIDAFARALAAADLATARRLYPGMPTEQREGFEALWKDGGTMTPRWVVSDVAVDGATATARIAGTNLVTTRRGQPQVVPVALRARLEKRGAEWRLIALVN
jgi:hypothetical protein